MEITAFLGGVSCKLYDDLYDNNLISNTIGEVLKGSQWILMTLLAHNDFVFAAFIYAINGLNAVNNWAEWDHPHESSVLLLFPIFLVISFSTRFVPNIYEWFYIAVFVLCMSLEPLFIKEEYSTRKIALRSVLVVGLTAGIYAGPIFGISPSILKVSYYSLGYAIVSVCFQAGLLLLQYGDREHQTLLP